MRVFSPHLPTPFPLPHSPLPSPIPPPAGRDTLQQLRILVETLGVTKEDLGWIPHAKAVEYITSVGSYPRVNWDSRFPAAGAEAVDLLGRVLAFSPAERATPRELLEHPYFQVVHLQHKDLIATRSDSIQ